MATSDMPLDPAVHFGNLRGLLDLDGAEERQRLETRRERQTPAEAERNGVSLLNMVVTSHTTGLGGRYLLTLKKPHAPDRLPPHRFRVGSPMTLRSEQDHRPINGVVSARRRDHIEVAVETFPEGDRLRVDLAPDEVTRRRQREALDAAEQGRGRLAQLRDLLMYRREPEFSDTQDISLATHLDESQQQAVSFALSAQDLAIVHGPPGTGKTTTVVEVIRQAVARGERVLACAPSNTAVDNLLERLIETGTRAVRLGHPARVLEVVRSHTLDALVDRHDAKSVIRDMLKEADQLERRSRKYTRARPAPGQKQQQRQEARELRRHARMLEQHTINQLIAEADVVCATVSYDFRVLDDNAFDLLVIDEACQSVEPGCWVPLPHANRVVLAGDHCQLPPTILSPEAADGGLDVSLMQRLVDRWGETVTRQLTVQYRMHEKIMRFSSDHFYDGTLTADASVAGHLLGDLDGVELDERDNVPVLFFDTAGAGWEERFEPEGASRWNPDEGQLVLDRVQALRDSGVAARDMAVIAPYAAQVRWLRERCPVERVEIDTVDGFQGREKEAVIICTVRSNSDGQIGFLADARRMNVALTRARRQLTVIGDSATLGADPFFTKLLEWFEQSGGYRTVWELM